jgi:hypothetical protein
VQRTQLRNDQEQKEHAQQVGVQKVLPSLSLPHAASGKQIGKLQFAIFNL